MKHKGSIIEFSDARNRELMAAYVRLVKTLLSDDAVRDGEEPAIGGNIYEEVVKQPSSRLWISEERAYEVVCARELAQSLTPEQQSRREAKRSAMLGNVRAGNVREAKAREGKAREGSHWPKKQAMYDELYRRYKEARLRDPDAPRQVLVRPLVYAPASEFYMSPDTARKLILRMLREARRERKLRMTTGNMKKRTENMKKSPE